MVVTDLLSHPRKQVYRYGLSLLVALLFTVPAWSEAIEATVCAVHDGDSVTLCEPFRGTTKVRLQNIDAPELTQPFGEKARDRLSSLVMNKSVELSCQQRKSYNRLVCRLRVEGQDIEATLVREGLAWDYPRYSKGRYQFEQQQAIEAGLGFWPEPPWHYRKR